MVRCAPRSFSRYNQDRSGFRRPELRLRVPPPEVRVEAPGSAARSLLASGVSTPRAMVGTIDLGQLPEEMMMSKVLITKKSKFVKCILVFVFVSGLGNTKSEAPPQIRVRICVQVDAGLCSEKAFSLRYS